MFIIIGWMTICNPMSWFRRDDTGSRWTRIDVDTVDEHVEMLETRQ